MKDFTLLIYNHLLESLLDKGFKFKTYEGIIKQTEKRYIILRHDVDRLPQNSLHFAKIQDNFGIKGTYYFRAVPESWDEKIIKEIHQLGHEIGYHYENLTTCKGNFELAIKDFETNLNKLRKLVPVSTICMHGSPRSPYDSRDLWKHYNYRNFGIIGEPYFDTDFSEILYLTDTGRRWNGKKVSIRDKINDGKPNLQDNYFFYSTNEIINALNKNELPDKIMFNMHPHRWFNPGIGWVKEFVFQNIKNIVKYFIIKWRNS